MPGRPTIWMIVGQGPIALAVGAVGVFGHFYSHLHFLFSFSLSLGDGPIYTEILSQRAVITKTTNQPTKFQIYIEIRKCFDRVLHPNTIYQNTVRRKNKKKLPLTIIIMNFMNVCEFLYFVSSQY